MRIELKAVTRVLLDDAWHDVEPGSFEVDEAIYTRAGATPFDRNTPYTVVLKSGDAGMAWSASWREAGNREGVVNCAPLAAVKALVCELAPPKPEVEPEPEPPPVRRR